MNRIIPRLLAAACFGLSLTAEAQSFPNKPLKIVVPYAPGGLIDMVGRHVAQNLAEPLGQPLVVENKPGAASAVGIEFVKQQPADGYTLVVLEPGVVITPLVQPKTSFSQKRDLQVVSIVADTPLIMTVGAGVPAGNVRELIALAKSRPGAFNYSSAGIGTTPHMAGELLKTQAGVDIVHVPYKGGSAAITDVLAGQIQMTFLASTIVSQYLKDGRMKAIASTGTRRSRALPDVQTVAESGFPDYEVTAWVGLFAVKGTPRDIVTKLNQAVKTIVAKPEFRAALAKADLEPLGLSVDEAQRLLDREERKWSEVVRVNNVKPD
jgi:tripartite-type tricarboxylate transporter receptor subunit TctC